MYKICILVRVLWPGGPQRIAFNEAKGLRDKGLDVELIFLRQTDRFPKDFAITNYNVVNQKTNTKRILEPILRLITLHYNQGRGKDATIDLDYIAYFNLLKSNYDLVIYFDQFTALFSSLNKILKRQKKIVYVHETAFREKHSYFNKLVERLALFKSDYILTESESNLKILTQRGYNKVKVLFPGIDSLKRVVSFDERDNILISATVWEEWRKPEILIEIAKNLKHGKVVLAGQWTNDDYKKNMNERIKLYGISDRIEITGTITQEELDILYTKSKVAIRFGYNERGPGMGSLEAISYGMPLIVNHGVGIKEFLSKYNYNLVFDENDIQNIAETVNKLFLNKAYWESISSKCLNIAKENTWEAHTDQLFNLIENALK